MLSPSHPYSVVWQSVREEYERGFCVSERGLQAVLYGELTKGFPEANVVVEPGWTSGGIRYVPDLVIVDRDEITDVFEIKFVPHSNANFVSDIRKLLAYGSAVTDCTVSIDPLTGKWLKAVRPPPRLRRHFVAVADRGAAAVWQESLVREVPELQARLNSFFHWYGRVGAHEMKDQEWGIVSNA